MIRSASVHDGVQTEDVKHIQILNLMAIVLNIYVGVNLLLRSPI